MIQGKRPERKGYKDKRYAVYHRKEGLQQIAARVHGLAQLFASEGMKAGLSVPSTPFFDTVMIETPKAKAVAKVGPPGCKWNTDRCEMKPFKLF